VTRSQGARAVIFDMDGVLCHYDLKRRLAVLARLSGRTPDDIESAIWGSGFEDEADSGRYASGAQYLEAFAERLGYPINCAEWIAARQASMTPIPEVLEIVRTVRASSKVALLSNNGPLTQEKFPDLFPEAARLFGPVAFFSWSFGIKKPNPQIYIRIAHRLDVAPSKAVFIDDKAHNVAGAEAAGLTAFCFSTVRQLMKDLASAQVV
jgi:glucose-1-phosphatase